MFTRHSKRYKAGFFPLFIFYFTIRKMNGISFLDFVLHVDILENTSAYSWDKLKERLMVSCCDIGCYLVGGPPFCLVNTCIGLNSRSVKVAELYSAWLESGPYSCL